MHVNLEVRRYNGFGRHSHDHVQILFPLQGAMKLTIDATPSVVVSNCVAVIPKVHDHEFVPSVDCSLLVLDVDLDRADGATPLLLKDGKPRVSRMDPWLWRIFRQIGMEVDADKHRAREATALAVSGLHLIRPRCEPVVPSAAVGRIERLVQGTGACVKSVADMARAAGLGQSQFHALFKATTGRSPRQFQIDKRLDAAIERIVSTADPVSEIAYALGYQNVSSFNRLFKRRFGLTPTEFRAADRRLG
jgi:AraC-like DNA-binding protein